MSPAQANRWRRRRERHDTAATGTVPRLRQRRDPDGVRLFWPPDKPLAPLADFVRVDAAWARLLGLVAPEDPSRELSP
jgi:hypothetical protein